MSSAESEYVAADCAAQETTLILQLLKQLDLEQKLPVTLKIINRT